MTVSPEMPADLVHGGNVHAKKASLGTRIGQMRDRVLTLEDGTPVSVMRGGTVHGTRRWHLSEGTRPR
jgi:hypothetical protein